MLISLLLLIFAEFETKELEIEDVAEDESDEGVFKPPPIPPEILLFMFNPVGKFLNGLLS